MEGTQDSHPVDQTGLCILSLDGGGVRGLSTLYILKGIMIRLNHERSLSGLPSIKPYEVFDLIAGTSTGGPAGGKEAASFEGNGLGGNSNPYANSLAAALTFVPNRLIAIMLGRLEMDVDECITVYNSLIEEVFKDRLNRLPLGLSGRTKPRFDSAKLRRAIERVIRDRRLSPTDMFNDGKERGCRVFVCTVSKEVTGISRLRSYDNPQKSSIPTTICEAALATSAATGFFDAVQIGSGQFVDGALGANNPVDEVEGEASDIWCAETGDLKPLVKCFISIGTGNPGKKAIEDNALKLLSKTLDAITTETETTARRFLARWRQHHDQKRYFRFNVEQGLQNVGLAEYKEKGVIEAATREYLDDQAQNFRVRDCVQNLNQKQNRAKLDLTEQILQYQSQQASRQSPHKYWGVTRPRNPFFTGREQIIHDLEERILAASNTAEEQMQCRIVISGEGGQGKSEVCLQLAHRLRQKFWGVFWVDVNTEQSAEIDFLNIAEQIGISAIKWQEVHRALANTKERWLLVLDNADDPKADYLPYFPDGISSVILLTTRNAECYCYASPIANQIDLDGLSKPEAQKLLFRVANIPDSQRSQFENGALRIAELVRHHPLALIQAGSYIGQGYCNINEYPDVFVVHRKRLLKFHFSQAQSRYRDAYATFEASAEVIRSSTDHCAGDALQLLAILATYAPRPVPISVFERAWKAAKVTRSKDSGGDIYIMTPWHASRLPSVVDISNAEWDSFRLTESLNVLKRFSLITTEIHDGLSSIAMHPLVYAWATERLEANERCKTWISAGCLMSLVVWKQQLKHQLANQLKSHVLMLVSYDLDSAFKSEPMSMIARILLSCGWFMLNVRADAQLIILVEALVSYLGPDSTQVNIDWVTLYDLKARNLLDIGKTREALVLYEKLVAASEQAQWMDHLDRLTLQAQLAAAYYRSGKINEAISLFEHVVEIRAQVQAEDHPHQLWSQHALAVAYTANRQLRKAIPLFEYVVKVEEQELEEDHPDRLSSQRELARAYRENGQLQDATSLIEHVVKIQEQVLEEDHPDRLASQHELARAYRENGQLKDAILLLQHVVKIREKVLEEDHPDRLASQHALALTHYKNGQLKEAIPLIEHVVMIREQVLEEDHRHRLTSEQLLATLYWELRHRDTAIQMMQRVVEMQKLVLDQHHPNRIKSERWIDYMQAEMSKEKSAEANA